MSFRYLPNLITGLRFFLVPPALFFLLVENYRLAFYIFLIASFSDGVDGILARYYGWTSRIGALLDPVADKLLLMGSFIMLTWISHIPTWITFITVGRDLWIMLGALSYSFWIGPFDYKPLRVSKWNTGLQLLFVLCLLVHLGFWVFPKWWLEGIAVLMCCTTFVSFVQYTWIWGQRSWQHFRKPLI